MHSLSLRKRQKGLSKGTVDVGCGQDHELGHRVVSRFEEVEEVTGGLNMSKVSLLLDLLADGLFLLLNALALAVAFFESTSVGGVLGRGGSGEVGGVGMQLGGRGGAGTVEDILNGNVGNELDVVLVGDVSVNVDERRNFFASFVHAPVFSVSIDGWIKVSVHNDHLLVKSDWEKGR